MFKFIHAADIHLDSPLKGLERYEGAPVDEIRGATRRALENLVEVAIDREVKFVLIAGDLYDSDWPDYNTGLYFVRQVAKLRDAGIPTYVISGNHDAENKMTKSLPLPENPNKTKVMLSSRKAETIVLEDIGVAIHGRGFASPKVADNIVESYPAKRGGLFNIGLLHTSLDTESEEDHARYAPCKLNDLYQKGYEYWALGHIHQRAIRHDEPFVVFPGNIQGRHIRETGAKGAIMVTVHDDHRCDLEFQPLDVIRWDECLVPLDAVQQPEGIFDAFCGALSRIVDRHDGMPLAVRVVTTGRSALHERLVSDPVRWTNQFRAAALDVAGGRVWIEKVKFHTTVPREMVDALLADGPIAEIVRYIGELRADDNQLKKLTAELDELRRKLPDDLKRGRDGIVLDEIGRLREALDEIEPLLVGHLHVGEGSR